MNHRPSDALARFCAGLQYDQIPEPAREHARALIQDAVGNMLAGHQGEETPQIAATARLLGASDEATVVGGGGLSLAGATLLNGYLVSAATAMDSYLPAAFHVTPETLPPALAIAERDHRSGRDLLVAVAAGLEVAVRIAKGINPPAFRAKGWHAPGVIGPFGGAAAAGRLLGLDARQQRNAFGLAGSQAAGTFAAWGTPTVKFHQCRGAVSGLLAAFLAQQDFPSAEDVLTAPDGGIFNTYSDGGQPDLVVDGLGETWLLEEITVRLWPTPHTHLITALLSLLETHDLSAAQVERLEVIVDLGSERAFSVFAQPNSRFEATNSLPFIAAVVLRERAAWLPQFGPERYADADLQRFMSERIHVSSDPALVRGSVRLALQTRNGRTLTADLEHAKGTRGNPATRADLAAKFGRCADGRLSPAVTASVLEQLTSLEQVSDVAALLRELRTAI